MDFRDQVDHKARLLAHAFWGELEKIAQFTAGPGAPPPAQAEAEEIPVEEGEEPPAHGVLGARVEQLDKKKARGIPIIQPPPGFVYAPDLAAFVPDPSQPGWMTMLQAEAAQSNKGYYDQGQHDLLAGQAQANVDQQVDQQNMAAQQQAEAEQQQGMQQQAMQQKAEQGAMNLAARKAVMGADGQPGTGDETGQVAAPPVPPSIAGGPPAAAEQAPSAPPKKKKSKPKEKKEGKESIRINIGR
jgi:hypothetical protein